MTLTVRSGLVQALLALAVVLSIAVAPVTAAPGDDDGGILGGDGDGTVVGGGNDTALVGNGSAVDGTTDRVSDTVDSATDGVDEAADSVESSADSEVTDRTADTVDAATDEVDGTVEDAASADGPADTVGSTAESVAETAESATDESAPVGSDDSSGPAETAAGETLERSVGTADLPVWVDDLPVEQLPATGEAAPVQPEDSPYGSEADGRLDACTLPVRQEDLPVEQVPGPGDLPVKPRVPGVPIDLLTPQAVSQLVFVIPPRPCEVYDPHDPSVDPTEPPTNPQAILQTNDVDAGADGLVTNGGSRGRLERGGVEGIALWGVVADSERVAGAERLRITDGRTRKYLYLESLGVVMVQERTAQGDVNVAVFGKNFGATLGCDGGNVSNAAPSAENPTGACEYGYSGLPSAVGPETIVDLIQNPPTESPVEVQD